MRLAMDWHTRVFSQRFNNRTVCDATTVCGRPMVEFGENHTENGHMGLYRDSGCECKSLVDGDGT